jgi:hypothetical protein
VLVSGQVGAESRGKIRVLLSLGEVKDGER